MRTLLQAMLWAVLIAGPCSKAWAQLDPHRRDLLQLGYNQPLEGVGPISAYAFYYLSRPQFQGSNTALRIALAPTFVDSELGLRQLLGPRTDLAFGVSGGGFADSYSEVRRGKLLREESFTGHGGEVSASLYHRFNPDSQIPLTAVLRSAYHYSTYARDSRTDSAFTIPEDRGDVHLRAGLRWGGREPVMFPEMAMELSVWYEAQVRGKPGTYGYQADRRVEHQSHMAWMRGLLAYTLPRHQHIISLSTTLGTTLHPDRFSAFRLGGALPLIAEFPLSIPGYYFQELSAKRFFLINASYGIPLDPGGHCQIQGFGATAVVSHFSNIEQPGGWQSGLGSAFVLSPGKKAWQIALGYGYGIDAMRSSGRGSHSIGLLIQYDFSRSGSLLPGRLQPSQGRGIDRILGK